MVGFGETFDQLTVDLINQSEVTPWSVDGSPIFSLEGPGRYGTGLYLNLNSPTLNDNLVIFTGFSDIPNEMILGLNIYQDNTTSGVTLLQIMDESFDLIFTLQIDAFGALQYVLGDNSQTYSSVSNVVSVKTETYIQFHVLFDETSTGSLIVKSKSNGVESIVINQSDIQTAPTGFNQGALALQLVAVGNGPVRYDDIYMVLPIDGNFTSFLGEVYGYLQMPIGAGRVTEWSPQPDTNQNWQNVDTAPNDSPGTNYVYGDIPGTTDCYTKSNVPENVPGVYFIQSFMLSEVDISVGVGNGMSIFMGIGDGTSETYGNAYDVNNDSYEYFFLIWEGDPQNDNVLWTTETWNSKQYALNEQYQQSD